MQCMQPRQQLQLLFSQLTVIVEKTLQLAWDENQVVDSNLSWYNSYVTTIQFVEKVTT